MGVGSGWPIATGRAAPASAVRTSGEELAAIIQRAAVLAIPEWRVTTALGLPLTAAVRPDD